MRIIIVGGVAAGASAAARARRLAEDAEIIVVERGSHVSFANCGLPYYIGGEIAERDKLLIVSPEQLAQRFRLDVRRHSCVESIDRSAKSVRIREVETGREYEESYDKLILAPGAAPVRPPIPGIDLPGIFTLRNLDDVDAIKAAVDAGVRRAVIVGAGFIGLEMVENFVRRGIDVTLVELQHQILPPCDREMTTPLMHALAEQGVTLILGDGAERFQPADDGLVVRLTSGRELPAELVLLSIGVRPENELARDAGLEIGERGGIRVDDRMQTSDPDIYAAGDVVEIRDIPGGAPAQIPLAGPANRQGRIAADNALGRQASYRGTQGTSILRLFGWTISGTGASESTLRRRGRSYRKVYVHPFDHATYYPAAEQMTLKLLFDAESGEILGAQGVGKSGVDKRIDVLSMAIQAGMTVFDLEEVELGYAPQYGSAKDPINMLGFVASGLLRGDHPQIDVDELLEMDRSEQPLILDVRTKEEIAEGQIPGAMSIPVDELRSRLGELPKDRRIAAYCRVGIRGYIATRILLQSGFDAVNVSGGYMTYRMFCP